MIYVSSVSRGVSGIVGAAVYVGRASSLSAAAAKLGPLVNCAFLGNPFWMANESERNSVCEKYDEIFPHLMAAHKEKMERFKLWVQDKNVTLVCFCAPKRCHADTIKRWLEA